MRLAISRRNANDPDSSDATLIQYINDFYSLTMSDDVRLFEQFGTLTFTIDDTNTTGVYTFHDIGVLSGNDVDSIQNFVSLSQNCYISLLDPVDNSVSWNYLPIFQDPGEFYAIWGINNTEVLIPGYPTNLLFYGNELVFRTIPNTAYLVQIFGYKQNADFSGDVNDQLPIDRWLRYIAYGAAVNYANDFSFDGTAKTIIEKNFSHERKLMLTHAHNQAKMSRSKPSF